jgi:hypothetical protein
MTIRFELEALLRENWGHDVTLSDMMALGYSKRQVQQAMYRMKGLLPITVVTPGQVWNLYDPDDSSENWKLVNPTENAPAQDGFTHLIDLKDGRVLLTDAAGDIWIAGKIY